VIDKSAVQVDARTVTLLEKLRKIEALHAGTRIDGEREAARRACARMPNPAGLPVVPRKVLTRELTMRLRAADKQLPFHGRIQQRIVAARPARGALAPESVPDGTD
jgi:hypothetical protein